MAVFRVRLNDRMTIIGGIIPRKLKIFQWEIYKPPVLSVIYILLMTGFALFLPDRIIGNFFHDDSYFYIKTAQNIHNGVGSSFDGINPTNGYHLLWLWFLVLFAKLNPFIGFSGIRPLLVLHSLFISGACLLANHLLKKGDVKERWRFIAMAALFGATGFVDLGVETPILLLTSWAFICSLIKLSENFRLSFLGTMIIILLSISVCLARTDAILLVLTLSIALSYKIWYCTRAIIPVIRIYSITILPSVIILLAVGFFNIATTGHFETISSSLKMHWPGTFATGWVISTFAGIKIRMAAVLLIAVSILICLLRKDPFKSSAVKSHKEIESILVGTNIYVILYVIVLSLFASGGVSSWYFALSLMIVIVSSVYVGVSALESFYSSGIIIRDGRLAGIILFIVFLSTGIYVSKRFTDNDRDARLDLAHWLYQNIPADQPVFQVDWTGLVAYFSQRKIINGDGIINNWEYQDFLRTGGIEQYLKNKHVAWIITTQIPQQGRVSVDIPVWNGELVHLGSAIVSKAQYSTEDHLFVFRWDDFDFSK